MKMHFLMVVETGEFAPELEKWLYAHPSSCKSKEFQVATRLKNIAILAYVAGRGKALVMMMCLKRMTN